MWCNINLSKVQFGNKTIPMRIDINLHDLCISGTEPPYFRQCDENGFEASIGGFHIGQAILSSGTYKFVLNGCDTCLALQSVGFMFLVSVVFAKEEYLERVGFSTASLCAILAALLSAILR